jgi:hypothetical protein
MQLTLLVPGLLWPREILRDTTFDLPLPALSLLLGRGRHLPARSQEAWLADAFGLTLPLPAAPLRLLGDGGSPGDGHWLCLDPVHLRLEERAVVVDDPARLALDADEDKALREALAPVLAELGELVAPVPGRWYLKLAVPPAIEMRDLAEAIGRSADPSLPAGPDGPAWRRRLAEAQILLHGHRVNRAREELGLPVVNSLWPWGLGRLPATACSHIKQLWADEPLLTGLARLAGTAAVAPPTRFAAGSGATLAHLVHLRAAAARYDAMAWREAMSALEADWLAPALAALRRGQLRQLRLVAGGEGRALDVVAGRAALWKIWRKPLALAELDP